jgi:hypothetical protein
MSGLDSRWAELADQNERFIRPGESGSDHSAESAFAAVRAQWAELASQRERLADSSDPLFGLASSSHGGAGMRLVASAA